MRSLAPPPDPSVEASLSKGLRRALDDYIELEKRVQAVASGSCAAVCAACRNPCCKAVYCHEAWSTPWLRAATAREGARREVAPGQAIEGHLARDGCRLRFGRPPVCYEFACNDVQRQLPTDDEKYLFRVISHVVTFAGKDALPGTHLVEVTDLGRLDRSRVARLRRRIALADKIFDAAARLFRARGRGLASDWALVTEHFTAKGYQLTRGEERPAKKGGLRPLPIVRALVLLAALALPLGLAASGCATPLRLDLASATPPAPAPGAGVTVGPNEYRDAETAFRFDASTDAIRVTIWNLSRDLPIVIDWQRAQYVDPKGGKHPAIGFQRNGAGVLRKDPPDALLISPGDAWSGCVHPRDRIPHPSGVRFYPEPLLTPEEAAPGTIIGLDLPVDGGKKPMFHEFRFRLNPPEVRP
jgi:hypothetical protein